MAKLITGGTGYIGAELAHLLVAQGEEVVLFDIAINHNRIGEIKDKVKVLRGDLGNFSEVFNAVNDNNITEIYHLGSMLGYVSEGNPWGAFRTNVIGTYNVLEAARLFNVKKMMFTSTLGTFGLEVGDVISDTTIQRPTNVYGVGKVYCEGLGRWYMNKFGLDFRSIRYAAVTAPGIRTPGHWWEPMIEHAIMGKPYECIYANPDSRMSIIYQKDAAQAAYGVLQASKDRIKMVNYNVTSIPATTSAKELETALKRRFPDFKIVYNPHSRLRSLSKSPIMSVKIFDDSCARKEWGWKPQYDTLDKVITQFEKDAREHPERYGLQ